MRFLFPSLLLVLCGSLSSATGGERPNLILIIADDMAWDDSQPYGHPSIPTPNFQRLAREGMRFEKAFLTASSCSPSRRSIVTGRYPHNTDTPRNCTGRFRPNRRPLSSSFASRATGPPPILPNSEISGLPSMPGSSAPTTTFRNSGPPMNLTRSPAFRLPRGFDPVFPRRKSSGRG